MKKETTPPTLRGAELARAAVNQILAHPESWQQSAWHSPCGTKHCFAGWCQILSGKPLNADTSKQDAREALGFSESDANWFFRSTASLGELHALAANFDRDGFGRDGFGRDGFDRDGFDRDGFDRDGFGRAGFDRDGFDRAGKLVLKPFKITKAARAALHKYGTTP